MTALVLVEGLVVLLLAVLVVGLLRSHAQILRTLEDLGLDVDRTKTSGGAATFALRARPDDLDLVGSDHAAGSGDVAEQHARRPGETRDPHDLHGLSPRGEDTTVRVDRTPGLTLLAFLSTGCITCLDFWDAFKVPANRSVGGAATTLVVLTHGPGPETIEAVARLADPSVTTLMSSEAFDDYGVPFAPYFVLVDGARSQVVGEGAATSFGQLRTLVTGALTDGGYPVAAPRSRRDVLRGLRRIDDPPGPRD